MARLYMSEGHGSNGMDKPIPERPKAEPEIIPPDQADARSPRGRSRIFVTFNSTAEGDRASVAAPGPFAVLLALLVLGALLLATVLLFLGAALIWIPVMAVIIGVLFLSSLFRGYFRRLRG
jgi:hypothetical protein